MVAGATTAFDTRLILGLRAALPDLTRPMQVISFTATGGGAIPGAILIGWALGTRVNRRRAWFYILVSLLGWLLNLALKEAFRRVRPHDISPKLTDAGWYSFPSGHAMAAVIIFGFGALLLGWTIQSRGWRAATIGAGALLTFLVGVSRVYLGAHWPTDVVGGWIAGAAFCAGAVAWEARRA